MVLSQWCEVIQVPTESALTVQSVAHRYGDREALRDLSLEVRAGEVFALLGPNGSGKTTLFRLISTLAKVQKGQISVFGRSTLSEQPAVRSLLGVVFQSPSLDPKLSVKENICCQAALYGIRGKLLDERLGEVARQLGIEDRLSTRTEELSGGLKRRVEIAKCILHRPKLMLMDEPSTGLDPASRLDMWHAIKRLQATNGVTIVLTTHLLEEADKADRVAIMDQGRTVAVGKPGELRQALGEQLLRIQTEAPDEVVRWLGEHAYEVKQVGLEIQATGSQAAEMVAPLIQAFGPQIQSVTLGQPSLEDVFMARTGHRFWDEKPDA